MKEILDEIVVQENKKIFSKLSFLTSLITFGLFIYLFAIVSQPITVDKGIVMPPFYLVVATQISCLIGMIMMVISFVKKEPSTWYKWFGGVLSTLLFLLIVGSVIFAKVVESG